MTALRLAIVVAASLSTSLAAFATARAAEAETQTDATSTAATASATAAQPACRGARATWNECIGTHTRSDGAVYVGAFRAGRYHGQATVTWPGGDRYIGEFTDGKLQGRGVYTYDNGGVYDGEFVDGKANGQGTYTGTNGVRYVGEWRDDLKHGQGTYTWASGKRYVGEFRDDQREGRGTETLPDGTRYVGEFRAGKRAGQGELYAADGKLLQSGAWYEDRFGAAPPEAQVAAASADQSSETAPLIGSGATTTVSSPDSMIVGSGPQTSVAAAAAPATAASAPAASTPAAAAPATAAPPPDITDAPAAPGSPTRAANPRVALVIGNGNYSVIPALRNARADAAAMAGALEALDFDVLLRTDLDDRELRQAIRQFKARLSGGGEAVFFFAGHGLQLGSTNYLLPTNIDTQSEEQVRDDGLQLQRVLDDLAEQRVRLAVAIIDACRDNPFTARLGTRSGGGARGLAPTSAATGQMILFSAGAGQTALDSLGPNDLDPNGLFTRVLLRQIRQPGVPVDQVLKRTRQEVAALAKSIGHEQVPALYDQTIGEFYFRPPAAGMLASTGSGSAAPEGMGASAGASGGIDAATAVLATANDDRALWASVKDSTNPEEIQAYLERFPQGLFAAVASARVKALATSGGAATAAAGASGVIVAGGPPLAATPPGVGRGGGSAVSGVLSGAIATPSLGTAPPALTGAIDLQKLATGTVFRDCPDCPDMVVIPPGRFDMGSPEYKTTRRRSEGPVRNINFAAPFAVGRTEVTWAQYARFVRETSRPAGEGCATLGANRRFKLSEQNSWSNPGFPQTDSDPVVCVTWEDAKAYAEWLGVKTGRNYRLLSEAEWEYAVRGGRMSERFWGESASDACRYANIADATGRGSFGFEEVFDCRDNFAGTAPGASFQPNPWGVHDMLGNVWEWTEDCWAEDYRRVPASAVANTTGDCKRRVLRGGSWRSGAEEARAAARAADEASNRYSDRGFRLARTN